MSIAAVIPVRDGAHLLPACLDSVLAQTRAADEVWIVVGPSRDGSRRLASSLAASSVRVLDNPAGDRGSAINTVLDATTADLVAMVDAQARLAADYLATAERLLDDPDISVVGGPMRPIGSGALGQAMAAALQSPFGVGDSQFHFAGEAHDAESVYLGVYRRSAFERIGRYNPALLRTEDDDVNARIRDAGMRIRLDPSIRSTYRCRESLAAIWRQYFGYGYWKVALATLRPSAIRPRHFAPAAFVLALVGAIGLLIVGSWVPLAVVVFSWTVAACVFATRASATSIRSRLLFPIVVLTMHVAYGAGTLLGVASWPRLAKQVRAAADAGGSR